MTYKHAVSYRFIELGIPKVNKFELVFAGDKLEPTTTTTTTTTIAPEPTTETTTKQAES